MKQNGAVLRSYNIIKKVDKSLKKIYTTNKITKG